MHKDCIILCHETDADGQLLCLKKINDKPFIEYLAAYFAKYHICKVIFSVEARHDQFKEYIMANRETFTFAFDFAESEKFLGTGTAITNALQYSDTPDVLVMQGHRLFDVNLDDLIAWQQTKMGDVTLALSYQPSTQNYLLAHLYEKNEVHQFSAGASEKSGLIASGVYCIFRPSFLNVNFQHAFSFEQDYLDKMLKERDFIGMISDGYFVDCAVPEMMTQASKDLPILAKDFVPRQQD